MTDRVREYLRRIRQDAEGKHIPVMREKTAELLEETVKVLLPERILEIGTCLGVSGITVLSSCQGRLTTLDIDGDIVDIARKNFDYCGLSDRVEFIEGDCFKTLSIMRNNSYQLIVLDGPKGHYGELYGILMSMLEKGGILFADDINFYGLTKLEDCGRKHRTIVRAMRKFVDLAAEDKSADAQFYDIEDGVAVIRKISEGV